MSLIVAANRDCLEEVRVLETAETDARTFALHTLTSLRMVRSPANVHVHVFNCITVPTSAHCTVTVSVWDVFLSLAVFLASCRLDQSMLTLTRRWDIAQVRDREDHDDDDGGGKESSSSSSSSSSTSFWSITKSFKQGLRDAVSSVKEQVADLSGKSEEFAQERLKKRFARVTAKTERAQEACAAYQTAINQLNARRERCVYGIAVRDFCGCHACRAHLV